MNKKLKNKMQETFDAICIIHDTLKFRFSLKKFLKQADKPKTINHTFSGLGLVGSGIARIHIELVEMPLGHLKIVDNVIQGTSMQMIKELIEKDS